MALRAAIYVRQSVKEDMGIKQQEGLCRSRVEAMGWDEIHVYNDNFVSATKPRNATTEWARMLADIDLGMIDIIVCAATDRLLRTVTDVLEVTAPKRKVRVVTMDGVDTGSGSGGVLLTIIAAIAQQEIQRKKERMIPYAASRRAEGHPTPGRVPYGYRWIPKLQRDDRETRYEIVPEEAEVVRDMFNEFFKTTPKGRRGSVYAVRKMLNDANRLTRNGTPWGSSTVRRLLMSPFLAGLLPERIEPEFSPEGKRLNPYRAEFLDLSKCTKGAWEPIVEPAVIFAAHDMLLNPSRRTHDGNVSRKWLLTGIAKCECGQGIRSGVTKERYRSYRGQCGHFQRRAEPIDDYVIETVIQALASPGLLVRVEDNEVDVDALNVRRNALEAQRFQLMTLIKPGGYSAVQVLSLTPPIDEEIRVIDAQIAGAYSTDPLAELVDSDDVRELWGSLTLARKQVVINALFTSVTIHPVGKGKRVTSLKDVAPTVSLEWACAFSNRVSFATGQPYKVPILSVSQKSELSVVLAA